MSKEKELKLAYKAYIEEVERLEELNYMKLEEALTYEEFCERMR